MNDELKTEVRTGLSVDAFADLSVGKEVEDGEYRRNFASAEVAELQRELTDILASKDAEVILAKLSALKGESTLINGVSDQLMEVYHHSTQVVQEQILDLLDDACEKSQAFSEFLLKALDSTASIDDFKRVIMMIGKHCDDRESFNVLNDIEDKVRGLAYVSDAKTALDIFCQRNPEFAVERDQKSLERHSMRVTL